MPAIITAGTATPLIPATPPRANPAPRSTGRGTTIRAVMTAHTVTAQAGNAQAANVQRGMASSVIPAPAPLAT